MAGGEVIAAIGVGGAAAATRMEACAKAAVDKMGGALEVSTALRLPLARHGEHKRAGWR